MERVDWQFYLCEIEDHVASIRLDLELANAEQAFRQQRPLVAKVRVPLIAARADGLTTNDEAQVLFQLEDALDEVFASPDGAKAGVITWNSMRLFVYFTVAYFSPGIRLQELFLKFPAYRHALAMESDPEWEHYFGLLYPDIYQLECIQNQKLLDVLASHNDRNEIPREVMHWIFLPTAEHRDSLARKLSTRGYGVAFGEGDRSSEKPFTLEVKRTQPVTKDEIDATVIELLNLALEHEGTYDGWETPVTRA